MPKKSSSLDEAMRLDFAIPRNWEERHGELSKVALFDLLGWKMVAVRQKTAWGRINLEFTGSDAKALFREVVHETASSEKAVEDIERMRAETDAPARKLILNKLLEETAILSDKGPVWRRAMMHLAEPLYMPAPDHYDDAAQRALAFKLYCERVLCFSCILGIAKSCRSKLKPLKSDLEKIHASADIIAGVRARFGTFAHKTQFIDEALAGRIFMAKAREIGDLISAFKDSGSTNLMMAAAYSYSLVFATRTGREVGALMDSLPADDESTRRIVALVKNGRMDALNPAAEAILLDGLRQILSLKRLPHPWYFERPGRHGIPVPRLPKDGIQMAAFFALARMRSAGALSLMTDAVGNMIIPQYFTNQAGEIVAQPSVSNASNFIARCYESLLESNGVLPTQVRDFTWLQFGIEPTKERRQSTRPPPGSMSPGGLLRFSPLMCRLAVRAEEAGAEASPLAAINREGFLRGLLLDTGRPPPLDIPGKVHLIERNITSFDDSAKGMFGMSKDDLLRMRDLIGRMRHTDQMRQIVKEHMRPRLERKRGWIRRT
jgi:hypothetical protein